MNANSKAEARALQGRRLVRRYMAVASLGAVILSLLVMVIAPVFISDWGERIKDVVVAISSGVTALTALAGCI